MAAPKVKPRPFVLRLGPGLWRVFRAFRQHVRALLRMGPVELVARPLDMGRSARANRLMWHWNGEAAMQLGTSPDWQHGEWKNDVLQPLLLTWAEHHTRAAEVAVLLDLALSRRQRLLMAHGLVHSHDLTAGRFGEALEAYRRHYAEQGVVLTDGQDLLNELRARTTRPAPAEGVAA